MPKCVQECVCEVYKRNDNFNYGSETPQSDELSIDNENIEPMSNNEYSHDVGVHKR